MLNPSLVKHVEIGMFASVRQGDRVIPCGGFRKRGIKIYLNEAHSGYNDNCCSIYYH